MQVTQIVMQLLHVVVELFRGLTLLAMHFIIFLLLINLSTGRLIWSSILLSACLLILKDLTLMKFFYLVVFAGDDAVRPHQTGLQLLQLVDVELLHLFVVAD